MSLIKNSLINSLIKIAYKLCLRVGKCNLTKQIYAENLHLKMYIRHNQF